MAGPYAEYVGWWIQQPVKSSWRVALSGAAIVVGVASAPVVGLPGWIGVPSALAGVIFMIIGRLWAVVLAVVCMVGAGFSYGALHTVLRQSYAPYVGHVAVVSGRVKEDISRSESGSYSVQLDEVRMGDVSLPGTVLVSSRTTNGALRGDRMTIMGELGEPFGSFPATLRATAVQSVVRQEWVDPGRVVRDGFADEVRTVIDDPQASLGIGFLTGQKSALPPDLSEALKVAGLTHIVVASGYNLTILVRMARKLFLRISKYLSALTAGCMIVGFVMVTGLSPSMTRAGLVSGMSLLAWYYGHAFHPFVLLPVAAAVTVVLQPSYVWGDMGWQLSFSAFFGVMVVAPLLQAYLFGTKEPGIVRQILGETVAAHLVTVPIIALNFGTISNVAIIANILVVPLVPLAMLLTFVCGMGALFHAPFIELVAAPTQWLLGYMTGVASFVSEIPWAQSSLEFPPALWLGYAGALLLICWWMWRKTNYNFRTGEPTAA